MYSEIIKSNDTVPNSKKIPFTETEIKAVWDNENFPWADSVLFLLYTGFRIQEALTIKPEHINLDDRYIRHGLKTKAGIDRTVPIHSRILDIVKARLADGGDYLFGIDYVKGGYTKYRKYWGAVMDRLEANHKPHECWHTFRTRLSRAGAHEVCINMIMGHKSGNVGTDVYDHRTFDELKKAVEMIS